MPVLGCDRPGRCTCSVVVLSALDRPMATAYTIPMTIGGGGPIVGRAIIQALDHDEEAAAEADAKAARAARDDAELREVERAEPYGHAASGPPTGRVASLLRRMHRLLRR